DVRVVKLRRRLESVEDAHVTMTVLLAGLQTLRLEHEVAEDLFLDQRDVHRRTNRRLIVTLLCQLEGGLAITFAHLPGARVRECEVSQRRWRGEVLRVDELV